MKRIIEITVSPQGNSKVETKGFRGSACRLASLFLEQTLGQRTSESLTPEFHQATSNEQTLQQRE